jgi:hypothetical protein
MRYPIDRRSLVKAGFAAEVALGLGTPLHAIAAGEDEALHGRDLELEIEREDRHFFPRNPFLALGGVIGGLVGFLILDNPIVLLAEKIGGTIVGGVDHAAGRYLADRSRSSGGDRASIRNAAAADHRADLRRTAPHATRMDQSDDEISAHIDKINATLAPLTVQYDNKPVQDPARLALAELDQVLTTLLEKAERLAGYASKHRDMGTVYIMIGEECGLTGTDAFDARVQAATDDANRRADQILAHHKQIQGLKNQSTALQGRR